jgi:PAS domain S-box-containing protein
LSFKDLPRPDIGRENKRNMRKGKENQKLLLKTKENSTNNDVELALKVSEERFRTLFENSPDAIFVEDLSGNVLDVNRAATLLHGIKREKMIGMNVVDLVPPHLKEKVSAEFSSHAKEGVERIESLSWKADGSVIPVEISVSRIEYLDEPAMLLNVRDISDRVKANEELNNYRENLESIILERTKELNEKNALLEKEIFERKKMEVSLRESEDRYRKLIELLPLAIMVYRDEKILYVNSMACEIGNLKKHEIEGKSIFFFLPPDYHELIKERYRLTIAGEDQPSIEIKVVNSDANVLNMELLSCKVNYYGEDAVLVVLNDVTHRKMLEDQLLQAQKMEAVGQLAGGIAHDFNNILTVIKGYTEIMFSKLDENEPLYKNVEQIRLSSELAESLTHQLLAFSRRQILQPEVLNLNDLILNLQKMMERLLTADISIKTHLSSGLWNIEVDPMQMRRVIMNLCINARDAMPGGGELILRTENIIIGMEGVRRGYKIKSGEYVCISIHDSGTGMDKETESKVFEPFFTTKDLGKGTGLGLSTVYGIIKQSEGYISVNSDLGRGTSFEILFPRIKKKDKKKKIKKERKANIKGRELILIVEDNESVREMTMEMLEMNGYDVISASNGEEALLIFENENKVIHLVITDVIMPGLSGHELSEHLIRKFPEVKILFMSGYSGDIVQKKGEVNHEVNYIQKPFSSESMLDKIHNILG